MMSVSTCPGYRSQADLCPHKAAVGEDGRGGELDDVGRAGRDGLNCYSRGGGALLSTGAGAVQRAA